VKFAIKLLVPIFVLALSVPAVYASHHGSGPHNHDHGAKAETPKSDADGKDCPYSKSDSACGTGKCETCAQCDAGECDGENCEEKGCGDCAAAKAECDKCAAAKAEGETPDCCKDGGECAAAKKADEGCPHCGKKN
jgi:hypothetical protein